MKKIRTKSERLLSVLLAVAIVLTTILTQLQLSVKSVLADTKTVVSGTPIVWGNNISDQLANAIIKRLGSPYGDQSFTTDTGTYDCSGLVYWALNDAGFTNKPKYPGGTSGATDSYTYFAQNGYFISGGKTQYLEYKGQRVPVITCSTLDEYKKAINNDAYKGYCITLSSLTTYQSAINAGVLKKGTIVCAGGNHTAMIIGAVSGYSAKLETVYFYELGQQLYNLVKNVNGIKLPVVQRYGDGYRDANGNKVSGKKAWQQDLDVNYSGHTLSYNSKGLVQTGYDDTNYLDTSKYTQMIVANNGNVVVKVEAGKEGNVSLNNSYMADSSATGGTGNVRLIYMKEKTQNNYYSAINLVKKSDDGSYVGGAVYTLITAKNPGGSYWTDAQKATIKECAAAATGYTDFVKRLQDKMGSSGIVAGQKVLGYFKTNSDGTPVQFTSQKAKYNGTEATLEAINSTNWFSNGTNNVANEYLLVEIVSPKGVVKDTNLYSLTVKESDTTGWNRAVTASDYDAISKYTSVTLTSDTSSSQITVTGNGDTSKVLTLNATDVSNKFYSAIYLNKVSTESNSTYVGGAKYVLMSTTTAGGTTLTAAQQSAIQECAAAATGYKDFVQRIYAHAAFKNSGVVESGRILGFFETKSDGTPVQFTAQKSKYNSTTSAADLTGISTTNWFSNGSSNKANTYFLIEVYTPSGYTKDTNLYTLTIKESDSNGYGRTVTSSDYETISKYTTVSLSSSGTSKITVTGNNDTTKILTLTAADNPSKYYTGMSVKKVDEKGNTLSGVPFKLYKGASWSTAVDITPSDWKTGTDGYAIFKESMNSNSEVTYWVKEYDADGDGYITIGGKKYTVDKDAHKLVLTPKTSAFTDADCKASNVTIIVTNSTSAFYTGMSVKKVDDKGNTLSGVPFKIYKGTSWETAVDVHPSNGTYTTGTDGYAIIKESMNSNSNVTYWVKEYDSDGDGYISIDGKKYKVDKNHYSITVTPKTTAWTDADCKASNVTISVSNTELIYGRFGIYKESVDLDGNKAPLAGITYTIYGSYNSTTGVSDELYTTAPTNSSGYTSVAVKTLTGTDWVSGTKTFFVRETESSANDCGVLWDKTVYKVVVTGHSVSEGFSTGGYISKNYTGEANITVSRVYTDENHIKASNECVAFKRVANDTTGEYYYVFTQVDEKVTYYTGMSVKKVDENGNTLAGVPFKIYKGSNWSEAVEMGTYYTGDDGYIIIKENKNTSADVRYWAKEYDADGDGYIFINGTKYNVDPDHHTVKVSTKTTEWTDAQCKAANVTITVTNSTSVFYTGMSVKKVDEKGNTLANVPFKIYKGSNWSEAVEMGTYYTGDDGYIIIKESKNTSADVRYWAQEYDEDNDGYITINGTKYTVDPDHHTVKVSTKTTEWTDADCKAANVTIVVTNSESVFYTGMSVKKVDDKGNVLPDVPFKIYKGSNWSEAVEMGTYYTGSDGYIIIKESYNSNADVRYWAKEYDEDNDGYITVNGTEYNVDPDHHTVKVSVKITEWTDADCKASNVTITVTNNEAVFYTGMSVKKVDEKGNTLANVPFKIYKGSNWSEAVEMGTYYTGDDGYIVIKESKNTTSDVRYWAKEYDEDNDGYITINSKKYRVDPDHHTVKVAVKTTAWTDADCKAANVTITVVNDETNPVYISKRDITSGKEVVGAKLEIYQSDANGNPTGNALYSWTSTASEYKIEDMPEGKYVLIETLAPTEQGYIKAENVVFEVKDNSVVNRVIMYDDYTKVDVSKTNINGSKQITGATLSIYKSENGVKSGNPIETWISDGKAHRITHLAPGEYVLVESKAPTGYFLSPDISFTVEAKSGVQAVTMKEATLKSLPTTGSSSGLFLYSLSGLLIMAGAAMLISRKKKINR